MNDLIVKLLGEWASDINSYSIILRLFISFLFGTILGIERASKGHVAGLRTYIITSLSATLIGIVDVSIEKVYLLSSLLLVAVAIIGSNSITVNSKNRIKGLTTTIGLLSIASLGIAIGFGLYFLSLIAFILVLICLNVFGSLESYLKEKSSHMLIHLELISDEYLVNFTTTIRKLGMLITDIEVNNAYRNTKLAVYVLSIEFKNKDVLTYKKHKDLLEALKSLNYIVYIEELI